MDIEKALKMVKNDGHSVRRMRHNQPNYNPDWFYVNGELQDSAYVIRLAMAMERRDKRMENKHIV